jgi:putative cell wall-binding protein
MTGGPVLLVSPGGLPAATANELSRLNLGEIIILGGEGAVSTTVAAQLAGYEG